MKEKKCTKKTLSVLLTIAFIVSLTAGFLSGCDKQGFICDECQNKTDTIQITDTVLKTDTVFMYYEKEDSVLKLLRNQWKLVAFVDDINGTRKEVSGYFPYSYTYTIKFQNFWYEGYSSTNWWNGEFLINTKTLSIYLYLYGMSDSDEYNEDGEYYINNLWKTHHFAVTSDSLRLYYHRYTYYDFDYYFLYKKIQ